MRNNILLIRADADASIGSGHMMRCLALAQAWKADGGAVVFVTRSESDSLLSRLGEEGFGVVSVMASHPDARDRATMSQALSSHPHAWTVLDGYDFDPEYQRWITEGGNRLLVIDDEAHLSRYYADLVLNQNVHAPKLDYSVDDHTELLLGSRYLLLRSEFQGWLDWRRTVPNAARHILITMGGGDAENRTAEVLGSLKELELEGMEVVVVAGDSNPHHEELAALSRELPCARLVRSATNMPELMAWADLAVSGSGSTAWELAFMQLPAILLVLASNQASIAAELDRRGAAVSLGEAMAQPWSAIADVVSRLASNKGLRQSMADVGRQIVDGHGAARVVAAMKRGR